jgi:uncharacterized RDD family membrane protein YckC
LSTSSQTAELATSDVVPAWKQEINARLSAHRTRRGAFAGEQPSLPGMEPSAPAARAAGVAARVAERYARVPTYSEMLAAEAAKAARAAEAAAEAARQAHEAAQAVNDVLRAGADPVFDTEPEAVPALLTSEATTHRPQYRIDPASLPAARQNEHAQRELRSTVDPYPRIVDPFEEALIAPAQPLPARVLEFPRELIATRKARPRLAEGPLLQAGPDHAQLRIFEVESETISHQPVSAPTAEDVVLPEWSSIRLDATPRHTGMEMSPRSTIIEESVRATPNAADRAGAPLSSRAGQRNASKGKASQRQSRSSESLPLHVAPIADRLIAAGVDITLILCAFLLFALVFVACTAHPPSGKPAMIEAAAVLIGFATLYQWLFFTYAESTPGMRYAKIALCTFNDENPGRRALQQRIGALFLAALPLGLGYLWAVFDDDALGWHDRMTRTYQRSYR